MRLGVVDGGIAKILADLFSSGDIPVWIIL